MRVGVGVGVEVEVGVGVGVEVEVEVGVQVLLEGWFERACLRDYGVGDLAGDTERDGRVRTRSCRANLTTAVFVRKGGV